jgi:hypothetical protein
MHHRISFDRFTKYACAALTAVFLVSGAPLHAAEKIKGKPGTVQIDSAGITYFALERDTLTTIAKRFTPTPNNWEVLGKLNKISNDRTIPIGSGILIPADLLLEEASQATVIALAGQVNETNLKGSTSALSLGSVVLEGSQIKTEKNSFVTFELPDNSRVSVPSNSQVSLSKLRMTQFVKSPRTLIKLVQGKVESKVSPLNNNKGRFEVSSPLAIAGVRGTHFRVGVDEDKVANEVLEGGVAVGNKEKTQALVLPAGQGNIVNKTGVGKAITLLPAPSLTAGFQLQERPILQFAVQALPKAVAYHAQISRDAQSQDVIAEANDKDLRFRFEGLDDGNYFIRVTAIDEHGLEGMPSTQAFRLKARPEPPFLLSPKHKVRADSVNFNWTQAGEVKAYRLQVASDAEFKQIVLDQNNIAGVETNTDKLSVGNYYWRVASIIEKNGQPDQGPFSLPQAFRLLAPQAMNEVVDLGQNQMEFGWPAEPGQTFLVQIAQDPEFKKIYLSRNLDQAKLSIVRPEPGIYYIRVQATDPDRFIGNFSKPQKFEILLRWTTGSGDSLESLGGMVQPQKPATNK